jgi:outer membrane autotransporter protein
MAAAWRADNGDLYQRMGNLRNNEAQQGVWGRIYTGENEVRKGIGLDLKYRAVQVGYDCKNSISDGKLFTGVAFGYFDGNVDYDHGSGESNSATVGAYATYLGRNGAYSDFIVKFGNIDNKLSYSSDNGNYYKADFDTYGLSADAEYGYRYDFNNNYYIEPLAQLSYIYIADEDYTMKLNGQSGAKVSNDDYQSLIGYTGFHYGKKFDDSVVYLRAVLAHEFAGDIDVKARYENTKVNSNISGEDTWVEYGVGFDVKVKEDTAIYGRVQRTTGDVVKNKWHASVGIRYTF